MIQSFDVIVGLGNNQSKIGSRPHPYHKTRNLLSIESKMTALAVVYLYKLSVSRLIIFSTGFTAGKKWNSEAGSMKNFIRYKYPGIYEENVLLEEKSFDTATNAKEVANMLKELESRGIRVKKCAIVTMATHLARARAFFDEFGIGAQWFDTEELLETTNYARLIQRYRMACSTRAEKLKEFFLRTLQLFDRKGVLLGKITAKRIH